MNNELGRDHSKEPKFTGDQFSAGDHLIFLRDTFSDVIPEREVHSNYLDNRYKVRKNWFAGVGASIENLLNHQEYSPETSEQIEAFFSRIYTEDFITRPTTAEDISCANALINHLVADVDSDPMLWGEEPTYRLDFVIPD